MMLKWDFPINDNFSIILLETARVSLVKALTANDLLIVLESTKYT